MRTEYSSAGIAELRDGNVRMSRLPSLLLLYKGEFSAGKYVSIEEQINTYRNYYVSEFAEALFVGVYYVHNSVMLFLCIIC